MARGEVGVRLRDKRNNCESIEVPIEDFIYHPYDIEFRFPGYVDEYNDEPFEASLPYNDFLFFLADYEVIVAIHNKEN